MFYIYRVFHREAVAFSDTAWHPNIASAVHNSIHVSVGARTYAARWFKERRVSGIAYHVPFLINNALISMMRGHPACVIKVEIIRFKFSGLLSNGGSSL
jgi:hypothetical protein